MLESVSKTIRAFIRLQGDVTSLLILPLLGVVIYEVVMRYVFNAPTIWAFETTTFLYGMHYMFGLSYTDVQDGHVRVDIFSARLPGRKQAALNLVTNLIFFMPVFTCMTIWSFKFAWVSVRMNEVNSTSWAPPVYPFKLVMAFCFLFLLLQGMANLLDQIRVLLNKNDSTTEGN